MLFSAMEEGVTVQNREFRIIYQNRSLQTIFGDTRGAYCYETYEGRQAVCHNCPVATCFADGAPHSSRRTVLLNGEQRIFENSASPIMNDNGQIVAALEIVRDITLRSTMEARLSRFTNMYAALSQTNKAILESTSREEMFSRICAAAVEVGKFMLAVIGMTDTDGIVRSVAHCGVASRYLDNLVIQADARTEEGRGPTGRAIRAGVPYICNDFHNDPNTTLWRKSAMENGIKASAAFPFSIDDKVVGALKVYSDQAGYFDSEITELLAELAANITFGLKNFLRDEQRRQSLQALRESEQQLQLVLEGSNDGFCDWHIPSDTVRMSARYLEILGYLPGEISQCPEAIRKLNHPEDWLRVDRLIREELAIRHQSFEIEARTLTRHGEWKWILYRGKVVEKDENDATTRVTGTCTDITDKKMFEEQLRHVSSHDQMTGLFNRAYFDTEVTRVSAGRNFPVSVVIADVDGLKMVNDSFGHHAGDILIQQAAEVLRRSFRAEDVIARIGGDEFAVLLPNADERTVKDAVKRVLHAQTDISDYTLMMSIGSATADHAENLGEAIKKADAQMYHYKFSRKSAASEYPGTVRYAANEKITMLPLAEVASLSTNTLK
jgi:diguanylate cyclase (GGDEF)-like protein/PAS domain S-box-containing protein